MKDLSVNLRREQTEGRCRVMMSEERVVVRLNVEEAVEIGGFRRLKSFVGDR